MFNDITSSYDASDASWEIIIMLLVAFILGFILRHLFGCKSEPEKQPQQKAKPQVKNKVATIKTEPKSKSKVKTLTRVELAVREMERENKELAASAPKVKRLTRVELAVREMGAIAAASPVKTKISEPESLQRVEGIGPKIEGLLHAGGILTMRELATADLNLVQDILTAAGPRYTMHSPKTWATQAELIADEKWAELKEYQDFLIGGREPES